LTLFRRAAESARERRRARANDENEPSELGDSLRSIIRDELHEREASEPVIKIE